MILFPGILSVCSCSQVRLFHPGVELGVPHLLEQLRPDHAAALLVHVLPVGVRPLALAVVPLGCDLHLWRVSPWVELLHVDALFGGLGSILFRQLLLEQPELSLLLLHALGQEHLFLLLAADDLPQLLSLGLQALSILLTSKGLMTRLLAVTSSS